MLEAREVISIISTLFKINKLPPPLEKEPRFSFIYNARGVVKIPKFENNTLIVNEEAVKGFYFNFFYLSREEIEARYLELPIGLKEGYYIEVAGLKEIKIESEYMVFLLSPIYLVYLIEKLSERMKIRWEDIVEDAVALVHSPSLIGRILKYCEKEFMELFLEIYTIILNYDIISKFLSITNEILRDLVSKGKVVCEKGMKIYRLLQLLR